MYISKSIQWLYKKSITKLYVVNWTLIDLFPGFQHQVKYWFANNDNNNILHKCPFRRSSNEGIRGGEIRTANVYLRVQLSDNYFAK